MDPATIAMLAQGVKKQASKLPNFGLGLYQFIKARQMEKRSKGLQGMEVPEEYKANLALANRMAAEGMPQQAYQNQQNSINRGVAFGVRQLQQGRNNATGISNLVANANRATQGLNSQDATMRQANQRGVMSARQILAQAKQRAFDQEQQAIASLRGAGFQNFARSADIGLMEDLLNEGQEGKNPLFDLIKAKRKERADFKELIKFKPEYINASPTDSYTV